MRLVGKFKDPQLGQKFSVFLNNKGIRHQLDVQTNTDWGSDDYGTAHCSVWVIDEDQFPEAYDWYEAFINNPFDDKFRVELPTTPPPPPPQSEQDQVQKAPPPPKTFGSELGKITSTILAICILLFVVSSMTAPRLKSIPDRLPYTPFLSSPVNKALMYDYPEAYDILDKAISIYGVSALETPSQLPPEGQYLLKSFYRTPYWTGVYQDIVEHFRNPAVPWNLDVPMFEKIREGEVWRLLTPCFLHFDIFHILFNMLWLIVLGKQMEKKLGILRYILFILIVGIISNTAQYLMSGPNFIGYSGVICGMIVFIWMRQKLAPWEGYQLQRSTMVFVTVFVFAILGIQLVSFGLEVLGESGFSAGIANTAHISGGVMGYILSRIKFFAWQR